MHFCRIVIIMVAKYAWQIQSNVNSHLSFRHLGQTAWSQVIRSTAFARKLVLQFLGDDDDIIFSSGLYTWSKNECMMTSLIENGQFWHPKCDTHVTRLMIKKHPNYMFFLVTATYSILFEWARGDCFKLC